MKHFTVGLVNKFILKQTKPKSKNKMPKATWNGAVLAESSEYEMVEGNYYFPPDLAQSLQKVG